MWYLSWDDAMAKWAFNTQHSDSSWPKITPSIDIYKNWSSQYLLCNQCCLNMFSPYIVRKCHLRKVDILIILMSLKRRHEFARIFAWLNPFVKLSRRTFTERLPPCRIIATAPGRFSEHFQIISIPPFPRGKNDCFCVTRLYISEDLFTLF